MFACIAVLSNEMGSDGGALAHAKEWASRLRLPLRDLAWLPSRGDRPFMRPLELCVFENESPAARREGFFSLLLRGGLASALICPPIWRPVSRVLVLNQHPRPGSIFLDATAAVCRAFDAAPVLLTVARSEAEARARERFTEAELARRGLASDCDFVAGAEVVDAAIRAARWRRCSHVFVEQRSVFLWQRWLGGDVIRELTSLPGGPALLAVHAAARPCSPSSRNRGDA